MKSAPLLSLLPLAFASCGVAHDWNEMRTAPMTYAECYDGIVDTATTGPLPLQADLANCDRGYGTWQSRWREVQMRPFGKGRYRLRAEVLIDQGSAQDGWIIRYVYEQQKVEDPRNERNPREADWSDNGQDREAEAIFGERLQRRAGVKS